MFETKIFMSRPPTAWPVVGGSILLPLTLLQETDAGGRASSHSRLPISLRALTPELVCMLN
jgi:hypothetical protein